MKDCEYINICDHYKNKTEAVCPLLNEKLKGCSVAVLLKFREKEEKCAKYAKLQRGK